MTHNPRSPADPGRFRQAERDEKLKKKEVEQKETDNRFTSPELIRSVEKSFGKIDFDPCWHPSSAVKPKAYLDVREGHNALRDGWSGDVVFVNPPWSAQDKFVRRAHDQWLVGNVETVVCLVPSRTDSIFFHKTLLRDADVYFIEGRPRFFKEDNTSEGTMVATMLVVFGATSLQKRRFAKLVQGAWLPRRKPSSRRKKQPHAIPVEPAMHRGPLYCSVPSTRHNLIVFCNQSAGRDKPVPLAQQPSWRAEQTA